MTNDTKPNWGKWSLLTVVEIQEAVALSMNFELNELTAKLPEWREVQRSHTFQDRLFIVQRSLDRVELLSRDSGPPAYWRISLRPFAALAREFKGEVPPQMKALAEPDKKEAEILKLKQQVEALTLERDKLPVDVPIKKSKKRSEAAIERHSNVRERTLAAVLATIATADRELYIRNTDQIIIASKLAGLVEDTRANYEKDGQDGKILSLQGIEDLIRSILNGKYFS